MPSEGRGIVTGMPQITIRRAMTADANVLAVMRYDFRSGLKKPQESRDSFIDRCTRWMEECLASEGWLCWVAESPDRIVGHLWLQAMAKVPNPVSEPERHAYVTNVFVDPDWRGAGIGNRLMTAAMDWCRSNGVDCAILWPTPQSRSLYARHGFRESAGIMELRFSDGAS